MTIAQTAPKVEVCFFAGLKDKGKGTLWSSWGDGCVARNGKYYTSVGDRIRALTRERLDLLREGKSRFAGERLEEIDAQLPELLHRHRLIHDALLQCLDGA